MLIVTLFDGHRKGMDLYFQRHDGQAVTCDDFRNAMADANDRDLSSFAAWSALLSQLDKESCCVTAHSVLTMMHWESQNWSSDGGTL